MNIPFLFVFVLVLLSLFYFVFWLSLFLLPCTLCMSALAFHGFFHRNQTLVKRTRQKDQKGSQE